jgi:hypothetical protein
MESAGAVEERWRIQALEGMSLYGTREKTDVSSKARPLKHGQRLRSVAADQRVCGVNWLATIGRSSPMQGTLPAAVSPLPYRRPPTITCYHSTGVSMLFFHCHKLALIIISWPYRIQYLRAYAAKNQTIQLQDQFILIHIKHMALLSSPA